MRGLACSWVIVLASCTAPNTAYQAFDDAASGSASDDTATQSAGSESGEPMECVTHPSRPLRLTVEVIEQGVTMPWEPECPDGVGEIVEIDLGNNSYEPNTGSIEHTVCSMCACPAPAPSVKVYLGSDFAFADDVALPDCTRLSLWTRMGESGCKWAGVVVWAMGSALPAFIGSNDLVVPPVAFLPDQPLTLGLHAEAACTDRDTCDARVPGRYALDVLGQAIVPVDDPPEDIEISLLQGAPPATYIFDNRESSISVECEPQVSWTAQHWPM